MAKKLAVIGQVIAIRAIEAADFIQAATVQCGDAGTWEGVVAKSVSVGQIMMVFLQDALLPEDARWAFMEKHRWRVRMARFKGVPSECLMIEDSQMQFSNAPLGTDLTEILGVSKYEKPVPAGMAGDIAGAFPSFLPKSDELNFQTLDFATLMASRAWRVTEKADGSSCTAWVDEAGLHVCSRNWELKEFTATGALNIYWRAARKYQLEQLPIGLAVQFEVVGPGVQSNPMGLPELEGRLFAAYAADAQGRWQAVDFFSLKLAMPTAKLLGAESQTGALSADQLRELAAIKYANGKHGEGIVIRALDQSWSFKVINLNYKD
jgi:RNA ligase (TIGR02306 family)